MFRGSKPAYVSLLADGSVLVATHGVELGQGLHTKVAQVGTSRSAVGPGGVNAAQGREGGIARRDWVLRLLTVF